MANCHYIYSWLFSVSTGSYATNIYTGMVLGHLTASKLITLAFLHVSHHSQALIWGATTLSRPNEFTRFHSKRQVILAKIHSYTMHKESCALGWCCRAHKTWCHRRYLACSFAELVSRRGFQNWIRFQLHIDYSEKKAPNTSMMANGEQIQTPTTLTLWRKQTMELDSPGNIASWRHHQHRYRPGPGVAVRLARLIYDLIILLIEDAF